MITEGLNITDISLIEKCIRFKMMHSDKTSSEYNDLMRLQKEMEFIFIKETKYGR